MPFNLDLIINEHFEQILKNYLDTDFLEDYVLKIEPFLFKDNENFFNTYLDLSYRVIIDKRGILSVVATSNSKELPIGYINSKQKVHLCSTSCSPSFEYFNNSNLKIESKKYVVTVLSKLKEKILRISLKIYKDEMATLFHKFKKNYLLNNYKEDNTKVTRKDFSYKKIESFEPYELTYKVFYELASRNENVKKLVYVLDYLHDIKKIDSSNKIKIDEIDYRINKNICEYFLSGQVSGTNKNNKIFVSLDGSNPKCKIDIEDNKFKIEIIEEECRKDLKLYITLRSENYQKDMKKFDLPLSTCTISITSSTTGISKVNKKTSIAVTINKIKYSTNVFQDGSWFLEFDNKNILTKNDFLKKYKGFLKKEEHNIYLSQFIETRNNLIKEYEKELIDNYLIYPEDYDMNNPEKNKIAIQRFLNNSPMEKSNKYFFNENEYDGYSVHQGILDESFKSYDINIIKQDMTKQVIDHNISDVQLNLNLPKDELLAYISKIKDNYDNDNSILKTPFELLGEELDIESEKIKNMDAFEWADTLYIYDYYNNKDTNENKLDKKISIRDNLREYRNDLFDDDIEEPKEKQLGLRSINQIRKKYSEITKFNKKRRTSIKEHTIENRYKFMKILIEEQRYKKLLDKKSV